MSERWFPSRVDAWIAVALALGPLVALGTVVGGLVAGEGEAAAVGGGIAGVMALVYLGLVLPMRYGFEPGHLVVRHGLVRQRIPLGDITEVRRTRNPLGAPALSLDRLSVRFGPGLLGQTLISPRDREGFLAELAARAGLVAAGEGLVRPSPADRPGAPPPG